MAIEAFYPSRCQSQRNNPLLARERRRKKLVTLLALAFGLLSYAGLRLPPGPAEASTASVHRIAEAVPSTPAQQRKVRIIPIYNIPSDIELGKS
jgi:hypothetical protein